VAAQFLTAEHFTEKRVTIRGDFLAKTALSLGIAPAPLYQSISDAGEHQPCRKTGNIGQGV
jgi:hypothetical protein